MIKRDMSSRWLKPVLMNFQKQKNYRDRKLRTEPEMKARTAEKKAAKAAKDKLQYQKKKTEELTVKIRDIAKDIKRAKKAKNVQNRGHLI